MEAASPSPEPPALLCLITFPDEDTAARVARALVDERLAACVSLIGGVRSIYRWQGAVSDEREVLALAKTTAARLPELQRRVVELHPYDVPEVVALAAWQLHPPYLAWLRDAVAAPADPQDPGGRR